jgi:branched-chain amino acid transport system permease protein
VIERLVLGKLVNQEGITLLMATLGITYFLDGFGQTMFGSTSTRSTSACPRTRCSCSRRCSRAASWWARKTWWRGRDRRRHWWRCWRLLPVHQHRPRAARGGRRPPGGAVDRHPAQAHLGHRLERGRLRGAGGRHHLGQQAGRAVLAVAGGAEGAAGGDPGRPDQRAGRHHRRPDHRRGREAQSEVFIGPMLGGGIEIWFAYVLALLFLLVRPQGLFGEKIIDRV